MPGDILLFASGHYLLALGYLIVSSVGGVVAVLLGDRLGQWYIRTVKRPSPTKTTSKPTGLLSSSPLDETMTKDHVDVQDDLFLPEDGKDMRQHAKTEEGGSGKIIRRKEDRIPWDFER